MKRFVMLIFIITAFFCSCGGKDTPDKASSEKKENSVPKITASAEKTKVHVGDLISLKLSYSIPDGSTFAENDIAGLDGLTVISKKTEKGLIDYTLLIDKTDKFDIGPVSLTFKDSKGALNIIRSEALHMEVLSNLGERPADAGLKNIMDIIPVYPLWKTLLPWIIGILVITGAVFGFYLWKKNKKKHFVSMADTRLPHEIALEDITKLRGMHLMEKGQHKEFYFRFSEILRQYLERLRGFPAAESTTEEIMRRIKDDKDRLLLPVLRDADLVKFADTVPGRSKNEDDIKAALEYINATKPVVEEV